MANKISRSAIVDVFSDLWDPAPPEFGGKQPMTSDRQSQFDQLRALAESVVVLDVSSSQQRDRGHRSWVWNAAALPAGGHYFPIFVDLIERLERRGVIRPETHVLVETTTGTAGTALGWIAGRLGYRIVLFMPEDMPAPRIAAVRANLPPGSKLILTRGERYVSGLVHAFKRFLAAHRGGYEGLELYALDHSRRPEAIASLREVLGRAISCLPDNCTVDYAVAALGNGTSSAAMFEAARSANFNAIRLGVEPVEAPMAFIKKFGVDGFVQKFGALETSRPHALLGTGGWGVSFPHLDVANIDTILPLTSETWKAVQISARERGLDFGNSTAACQAGVEIMSAQTSKRPLEFFSILYDQSDMY